MRDPSHIALYPHPVAFPPSDPLPFPLSPQTLRICDPLTDPYNVTSTVFNWLASAIGFMAMADYPYPADFLGPMPAWPVNVSAGEWPGRECEDLLVRSHSASYHHPHPP